MDVHDQAMLMAMPWECFGFGFAMVQHGAPLTLRITCSLGRQYAPILSLSFFDAYGISDQSSLFIHFIVNHSKNIWIKVFVTITPLILPQCLPPRFKIPGQNAASISPL